MKGRFPCPLVLVLWLTILLFAVLSVSTATADESAAGEVKFRWAFGVVKGTGGVDAVTLVTRDTEMASGDRIKIYLEPTAPCFVYLFYLSSQGELEKLFPNADQPSTASDPAVYIPEGDLWFRLDDHPGRETFFLLASAHRLSSLEEAFEDYRSAEDLQLKKELQEGVVDQIRRVRRARQQLSAAAERPIPVGGSLRGVTQGEASARKDLAAMAVEITASGFYSRTFTIDHR